MEDTRRDAIAYYQLRLEQISGGYGSIYDKMHAVAFSYIMSASNQTPVTLVMELENGKSYGAYDWEEDIDDVGKAQRWFMFTACVTGSATGTKGFVRNIKISNFSFSLSKMGKWLHGGGRWNLLNYRPVGGCFTGGVQLKYVGGAPKSVPAEPYNRRAHYGKTPTAADREAVGAGTGEVADHDPPLVKRYYEGDPAVGEKPGYQMTPAERKASAGDQSRMSPQPRADSDKQGADMSRYSRGKKKEFGL